MLLPGFFATAANAATLIACKSVSLCTVSKFTSAALIVQATPSQVLQVGNLLKQPKVKGCL